MSASHSIASISVEEDPNAEGDNVSNPVPPPVDQVKRRKRWTFRLGQSETGDGGGSGEGSKFKSLTVSCRCKGAIKGSCLILATSLVEMLGNLIALAYGITYILAAVNFYELESDPEKRAKEYDEQLQHVLFLEKYRVGFVGLIAISLVGLVVSFLMPIGTIYKSWKSIRTSMSLLFAMCVFHLLLVLLYLPDSYLQYTIIAVPFRLYEISLLYSYIRYYKKKKLEDLRSGKRKICGSPGSAGHLSHDCIDTASLISIGDEQLLNAVAIASADGNLNQAPGTFELKEGSIVVPTTLPVGENIVVVGTQAVPLGDEKGRTKRNRVFKTLQGSNKNTNKQTHQVVFAQDRRIIDNVMEYK